MDILKSILGAVTQPETPLHLGEAMAVWTALAAAGEGRSGALLMLNHTADPELRRILEHYVTDVADAHMKRLRKFAQDEGIPLPPVTPDKTQADERDVPQGAKLTDEEVANLLLSKILAAVELLHTGVLQTVREDVGALFLGLKVELLKEGFALKRTMQRRGWLKVPPYYNPGTDLGRQ